MTCMPWGTVHALLMQGLSVIEGFKVIHYRRPLIGCCQLTVLRAEDVIKLFGVSESDIDCAGLRLRLAEVFKLGGSGGLGVGVKELPKYVPIEPVNGWFRLGPGPYLIRYAEYVRIPNGYVGLAIQRSTLVRMGATLYTAVWDPGYEGRGAGLLVVHNPYGVRIEVGAQVAQLVLIRMSGETKYVYRGTYLGEGR